MLSSKNFQQIHEICQQVHGNQSPFGGIQITAGGSFKQLPPIPNYRYLDNGDMCFSFAAWNLTFPSSHCLLLEEVLRTKNIELARVIGELESTKPSKATHKFLSTLSRPLYGVDPTIVTHLFAKREDVNMFNIDCLNQIPGEARSYASTDTNVQRHMESALRTPKVIKLKVGAPVILQTNLCVPKGLVNGTQGIVKALNEKTVTVTFGEEDIVVQPHQYSVYDVHQESRVMYKTTNPPLVIIFDYHSQIARFISSFLGN